jgi:hypothetical protein
VGLGKGAGAHLWRRRLLRLLVVHDRVRALQNVVDVLRRQTTTEQSQRDTAGTCGTALGTASHNRYRGRCECVHARGMTDPLASSQNAWLSRSPSSPSRNTSYAPNFSRRSTYHMVSQPQSQSGVKHSVAVRHNSTTRSTHSLTHKHEHTHCNSREQ